MFKVNQSRHDSEEFILSDRVGIPISESNGGQDGSPESAPAAFASGLIAGPTRNLFGARRRRPRTEATALPTSRSR